MRSVFAAFIISALVTPAASALPAPGPEIAATADVIVQSKASSSKSASSGKSGKSSRSISKSSSKKNDLGIHPLVGSGDY